MSTHNVDKVEIHEYDPNWVTEYEQERERVTAALAGQFAEIEHVGSTAVPGLAAKPVIDLQIAVAEFAPYTDYVRQLAPLGYEFMDYGDPDRLFFRKGMPRTHHLHIVRLGSWDHRRHLLFRDFLRTYPEAANEYAEIKKESAVRFADDRPAYVESKTSFIEGIVKQAQYVARIQSVYPDFAITSVHHNRQGQNNDVLFINDEWVFRFPKYERGIEELRRETAILQAASGRVTLAVPNPVYLSLETGVVGEVFAGYRMIPGTGLTPEIYASLSSETVEAVAEQLGTFLRELHSVPVETINHNLPLPDLRGIWVEMYENIQTHLFPHMRPDARESVAEHFETFLSDPRHFDLPVVLIHSDLGMSNILFDPQANRVSGIIDFGFAQLGDAAGDFANFLRYGDAFMEGVCRVYPEAREYARRCRFYLGTFALQEALFGVEQGDEAAFAAGMADYI